MTSQNILAHPPPWECEYQYDYPNKRRVLPTCDKGDDSFAATGLPSSCEAAAAQSPLDIFVQNTSQDCCALAGDQVSSVNLSVWDGGFNSLLLFENSSNELQNRQSLWQPLHPENHSYIAPELYTVDWSDGPFRNYHQSPGTSNSPVEAIGIPISQQNGPIPCTPGSNNFTSSHSSPLTADNSTTELRRNLSCTTIETVETSSTPTPSIEVCFGMIVNVGVDLFRHSKALKGIEDNNETKLAFRLRYRTDGITVLGSDLEEIGRLDTRSADTLKGLKEAVASIRCDVNVIRDLHNSGKNYKSSEIFKARLIIYGNEDEYDRVGSFLSEAEIFLQEPDNLISGVVYCNPHVYTTDKDNFMTPQFLLERVVDELDFQEAVEKIICTPEFPRPEAHFIQDHRLKTLLHRHQLTAVRFMRNREEEGFVDASLTLWQSSYSDGGRTYKHDITRESFNKPISECRGGLLMDEMGMGKSLSTLALIVHTLEKAELFEVFSQNIRSGRKRRRSTLIITTATTIQNWLSEIQSHIVTGSIRVHVYHGQSKKQGSLDNYDIVFTSYETAAAELRSGTSTLHQIEWFRVVLDEAHRVRNTATDNYRAVSGLHAERRWCLTGTPIHNGLNDLFSLTKFLQLYPFDRDSDIRKYITGPIQRRKQEGLDNLQSLIRVFALRRIKESKDYPDRHTRTILIDLTPTERLQYQLMRDNISVDLSKARECNALQSSQIILKGINRLMQFCSYGLASTDDHQVCEQLPNDSEHPSQAVQALRTMDLMTNSVRQYEETFNDAEYSHIYDKLDTLALLGQGLCTDWSKLTVSNDKPSLTQHANNNNRLDINGTYASYQLASKLSMVLLKLVELNQASSQSIKLPEKSLVFSFWKKPLKLLELALSRQKIGSVRIDGDCTLDQRDTALTKFKSDSDITVLLITFGIGSFGLNLTQASHVHIIDPQWNPMIEEQAAARVHRIGQTKPVFINRYIIANSVEEKIQNRQNRKRWFADISELKDTNKVAKEDLDDLIAIL